MINHTVTEEQFLGFVKAWESIAPNTDIDPSLINVIRQINRHPKVVTRWSCEGHPDRLEPEYRAYVTLVTTDVSVVYRLWQAICNVLGHEHQHLVTLDLGRLCAPHSPEDDVNGFWYPTFTLSWIASDDAAVMMWSDVLDRAVSEWLDGELIPITLELAAGRWALNRHNDDGYYGGYYNE